MGKKEKSEKEDNFEKMVEQALKDKLKREKFDYKNCPAMKWINNLFKAFSIKTIRENVLNFTIFCMELINKPLPREGSRFKELCVWFLDQNLQAVKQSIQDHPEIKITIKNDKDEKVEINAQTLLEKFNI